MKIVIAFALGIVLAIGVIWLMSDPEAKQDMKQAGREIQEGRSDAGQSVKKAVDAVDVEAIKEGVQETGRKAADKTKEIVSDASITASIKMKFAADAQISALSIDVDTTDGLVTLSGRVNSNLEKERAMSIALQVAGVKNVVSTLQVQSEK